MLSCRRYRLWHRVHTLTAATGDGADARRRRAGRRLAGGLAGLACWLGPARFVAGAVLKKTRATTMLSSRGRTGAFRDAPQDSLQYEIDRHQRPGSIARRRWWPDETPARLDDLHADGRGSPSRAVRSALRRGRPFASTWMRKVTVAVMRRCSAMRGRAAPAPSPCAAGRTAIRPRALRKSSPAWFDGLRVHAPTAWSTGSTLPHTIARSSRRGGRRPLPDVPIVARRIRRLDLDLGPTQVNSSSGSTSVCAVASHHQIITRQCSAIRRWSDDPLGVEL